MTASNCPIWGTPAREHGTFDHGGVWVDSPRADGRYGANAAAMRMLPSMSNQERAKLTTWIVDQHRSGVDVPEITDAVVREVWAKKPLRTSERIARLFLLLSRKRFKPADAIQFAGDPSPKLTSDLAEFAAWLESEDDRDTIMLIRLLISEHLLEQVGFGQSFHLTAKGFERLEQSEISGANSDQAFVAMWFDPSVQHVFNDAIDPAVRDAGYKPFRIDQSPFGNSRVSVSA